MKQLVIVIMTQSDEKSERDKVEVKLQPGMVVLTKGFYDVASEEELERLQRDTFFE